MKFWNWVLHINTAGVEKSYTVGVFNYFISNFPKMQNSLSAEDSSVLLPKDSAPSKLRGANNEREWPQRILKFLSLFVLLASGIIMGVVICSNLDTRNLLFPNFISSSSACRNISLKKAEGEAPSPQRAKVGEAPSPEEAEGRPTSPKKVEEGEASIPKKSDEREAPMKLKDWIRLPRNLAHNMTDDELFWRASFVPIREEYPFKRVPKVAFMFLTKGPLPLSPLWEIFFHGHEGLYSIYVHSLPNYPLQASPKSVFYRRQIPSKVAEWGHVSLCDAERRLLANALLDFSNFRFVLLSESCIPVFNFTTVYNYLIKSRHSFISSFDDKGPYGRGRYNPNMQPEVTLDQWRKGSQWFEVDRKLAIIIISDNIFYPKFEKFCPPGCFPSEHYFTTMLSIRFGSLLANRSVTWVDWSRWGPHPAMFGKADITKNLIGKIRDGTQCTYNNQTTSVCFLFARKFAPNALDPLLQLLSKVLGSG